MLESVSNSKESQNKESAATRDAGKRRFFENFVRNDTIISPSCERARSGRFFCDFSRLSSSEAVVKGTRGAEGAEEASGRADEVDE